MHPVIHVVLRLTGLNRFARAMRDGSPAMTRTLRQWAVRYRSFAQLRFDLFSRGGGDWPPLKESTIRRRRQRTDTILRDTGTLFRALNPVLGNPGSFEQLEPMAVIVGFGGPGAHPSGTATIADIAAFHNFGAPPNLPQRQIIVEPPQAVIMLMSLDAERNLGMEAHQYTTHG